MGASVLIKADRCKDLSTGAASFLSQSLSAASTLEQTNGNPDLSRRSTVPHDAADRILSVESISPLGASSKHDDVLGLRFSGVAILPQRVARVSSFKDGQRLEMATVQFYIFVNLNVRVWLRCFKGALI